MDCAPNPALALSVFALLIVLIMFLIMEKSSMSPYQLALVATLSALAAAGRIPFALLPGVQATTFVVMVSGYVLGPFGGFLVGITAAFVSNLFLGQGLWTPWQMLGWGLSGALAGWLKPFIGINLRLGLALLGFLLGYLFGWITNISYWLMFLKPLSLKTFLAAGVASFWFDSIHALNNLAWALMAGPFAVRTLENYYLPQEKRKTDT